jgi:hypothetical protein
MCKKMLVVMSLVVMVVVGVSGCDGGITLTTQGSLYYPTMQTAEGGGLSDPGGRGKTPGFVSGSASNESTSSGFGKWKK